MVFLPVVLLVLLQPSMLSESNGDDLQTLVTSEGTFFSLDFTEVDEIQGLPGGLTGYSARGCSYSGSDGNVLLPARDVMLAVPPGAEVRLQVLPQLTRSIGSSEIASVNVDERGLDVYSRTDSDQLPSSWGRIIDSGTYRRAGYVRIRLHPVIVQQGELIAAERLSVRLIYSTPTAPRSSEGISGSIFRELFLGGNRVWEIPSARQSSGPFWGLPWYALKLDTAGIYRIECDDVPETQGYPSASISLFCGFGRDMGDLPWENAYYPRAVPILMDDGGDGTFDPGDSFCFFGRGLSWWETDSLAMPDHFNHRFDTRNTYWLTWGGEDGARMTVQDGSITGAPAMPDSFLARYHFEENNVRTRNFTDFPDEWGWFKSEGSSSTWHYFNFDLQGASGAGYLRLSFSSSMSQKHHVRILLNSTEVCDSSWSGANSIQLQFQVSNMREGSNTLAVEIVKEFGNDVVFMDWYEAFPWIEAYSDNCVELPLNCWSPQGRHRLDWSPGLQDVAIFLAGNDTNVQAIDHDDQQAFEFQIPDYWSSSELWLVDADGVMTPADIERESPGTIMGTAEGGERVYVVYNEFIDDIAPLVQGDGVHAFSTEEVYQEFNGGVRDPGAIRAMVSYMIDTWNPPPMDLVLVGAGTWDPLHYSSSKPCLIDIQYYGISSHVSDDVFSIVESSSVPQIAVSRIGINNAGDLQLVLDRAVEYRAGENLGDWQTVVIGAADDERSPLYSTDELYHTREVDNIMNNYLPAILRPEKLYMILYDWNSTWAKPEAREDFIRLWSEGALISVYLGHGGYDQLADEGLLFLEDNGLLACGPRQPMAFFMSCDVGQFQNPAVECIAQQIITSPAGGAIMSLGATGQTNGPANEALTIQIFNVLLDLHSDLSAGMAVLTGKINYGYNSIAAQYILFGDGSLPLALPRDTFSIQSDSLRTGELCSLSGSAPSEGLILLKAWESCQMDTYYTFQQHLPLDYLSMPSRFYWGTLQASPDFESEMFVPLDSDTGKLARTQLVYLDTDGIAVSSTYPQVLQTGIPSGDTQGPEIDLWIEGYRNVSSPEVSGIVTARAELSDSSGINLLGNTGRQLTLYLDGEPRDVSSYFQYYSGSSSSGELRAELGELQPGDHSIELRAVDGLLNISQEEIGFSVTEDNSFGISEVFPYPNPCSEGTSINWTQTSPGRVDISIFTVAGRRVARFGNIQGSAGYNQYWWDCRDADGDEVASGSYIFAIKAASYSSGGESEKTGVIAIVRD